MSTRKWTSMAVVGGVAVAVLLLSHHRTVASEQNPQLLPGTTALGRPLPWPAEFDTDCIGALPRYSPSGHRFIVQTNSGQPLILDLDTGSLLDVYDCIGRDLPNLWCTRPMWLTDEQLLLPENWIADVDLAYCREAREPFDASRSGHGRNRIVDLVTGATVLQPAIGVPGIYVEAFDTADRWVARDWSQANPKRRFWYFDPRSQALTGLAIECSETESLRWRPCGPWFVKVLAPRSVNPSLCPVDLALINYRTGETRVLRAVPPIFYSEWGPLVTADGRYVLTATFQNGRCWTPLVFDMQTGQRRELPPTESWVPCELCEPRGVLLAALFRERADGLVTTDYIEFPLSALLSD